MWPRATSDFIAACTVRSLLLHFDASVAIEGQHRPSSFALSARASNTIFSLSGRLTVHTAVMMRTLIAAPLAIFGRFDTQPADSSAES